MESKRFIADGHLVDSGILPEILNLIIEEGADYEIAEFRIGKTNENPSHIEMDLICSSPEEFDNLSRKLVRHGVYEKKTPEAVWQPAAGDGFVPEGFYSTTNHRTQVFDGGRWQAVSSQRMDAVIRRTPAGPECVKLRDVKGGDEILCSHEAVRVFPPARERETDLFGFMNSEVSSERSVDVAVQQIAKELREMKERGEKLAVVAGPVVVHTGGAEALAALIREGYVQGFLGGNAIAVHDMESYFYNTSLGVDMTAGRATHGGHNHHMRAINKIRGYGSIRGAIEAGALKSGLMYEVIQSGIPFCLAGSIRDDGPLPETVNDMIRAQGEYTEILRGSSMVMMLASMLHSIGTGNMLPSWVKTVCIDINPAVVTKLSDRGSSQTIGIVSDVGFFLRALAQTLIGSY